MTSSVKDKDFAEETSSTQENESSVNEEKPCTDGKADNGKEVLTNDMELSNN